MTEPKDRILYKAHELYNRYGIRSVSMDDIATQVGMSKKTLYQYFTDKDELVDAVFSGVLENNKTCCRQEQLDAANAVEEVFIAFDRVQEMFSAMNPAVLFDLKKYHSAAYQKFREFQDGFLYGIIRANLERGIREELYRPEIDLDVISRYRIHSVMLAFDADVFPANRTHLMHIQQQLLEHFLYGVTTLKGQKLIARYKQQRTKNK